MIGTAITLAMARDPAARLDQEALLALGAIYNRGPGPEGLPPDPARDTARPVRGET